jgi:N-methylhydantoinase B
MNVRESPTAKAARAADAITQEIINGKLLATVDEMAIVLARTSMSPVVYEVLDFACGICDAGGELVAQTNGITIIFTGTFSRQVQFILQRFGGDMTPGDTFLTNDPSKAAHMPATSPSSGRSSRVGR